jgi:hypothetical protein
MAEAMEALAAIVTLSEQAAIIELPLVMARSDKRLLRLIEAATATGS